jgi:DNA-directed RNA polymerase I, II, and III subunit RPABC2
MIYWLSKSDKNNDEGVNTNDSKIDDDPSSENNDSVDDNSTENAILDYRKIREDAIVELTEKDIAEIDKECKIIADRETITRDSPHTPTEIINEKGLVVTGPPTLTRFEKARIMGARALQLSLGAPVFITIPKNTISSLEIAMEELNQRLLPVVIKRSLPNGDYQNIPIDKFQ